MLILIRSIRLQIGGSFVVGCPHKQKPYYFGVCIIRVPDCYKHHEVGPLGGSIEGLVGQPVIDSRPGGFGISSCSLGPRVVF